MTTRGYLSIEIDGKAHYAHRLAWLYVHGKWPESQLDHKNGERASNQIENLREATAHQNALNRKVRSDNTSGTKGVSWNKKNQSWAVAITVNKKREFLGYFKTKEDASLAARQAREELHGEFAKH